MLLNLQLSPILVVIVYSANLFASDKSTVSYSRQRVGKTFIFIHQSEFMIILMHNNSWSSEKLYFLNYALLERISKRHFCNPPPTRRFLLIPTISMERVYILLFSKIEIIEFQRSLDDISMDFI